MGIELQSLKGWGVASKPCDTCKAAPASVYCRVDSAFLCLNCDSRIHSMNKHERVWMCEVCEQAPAAVTCKADAAALCVTCDNDIHSANPLARRHERTPVEPFYDSTDSIVKSTGFDFTTVASVETTPTSWLFPPPPPSQNSKLNANEMKSGDLFFTEMGPFIDFEYQNSFQNHSSGMDSVVPVQSIKPAPVPVPVLPIINSENCFDIDFCRSKLSASFSYQTQSSLSHSVSSSDVGVVPDGNTMSDISYPFGRNTKNNTGTDPISTTTTTTTTTQATQLCGIDREARVLRYREKRKNRKFEKTIRYHSRKAYAETRPRIKGRFAKRTETGTEEVDCLYNNSNNNSGFSFMTDNHHYGVVPSFCNL